MFFYMTLSLILGFCFGLLANKKAWTLFTSLIKDKPDAKLQHGVAMASANEWGETLNDYQKSAMATACFPEEIGLQYTALGLAGEAGEYSNKVKKWLRGDYGDYRKTLVDNALAFREQLALELGDVLWYVSESARVLDFTLYEVAMMNLNKLASRNQTNSIKGTGDHR